MNHDNTIIAEQIRLRGTVQGVGMRPTVWRLANDLGLRGSVCNDAEGVLILAQGTSRQLDQLIQSLREQLPPLARIDSIERQPHSSDVAFHNGFQIQRSQSGHSHTGIAADAATCPACLAEIFDPNDRRYRYPFTNCTHCGPRLSIIKAIPYDRANTSMAAFPQCPDCQREYDEPGNRRFHAQPNACPACGPSLWLEDAQGQRLQPQTPDDVITLCAQVLHAGKIVAIKGIGGFHLACDATNANAVRQLRERKQRYHKPLALMARDIDVIHQFAKLNEQESTLLKSPAAPIVILRSTTTTDTVLAADIAPAQNTLGFMLPYTPLHHLLLQTFDNPVVMTSGNRSQEPQCIDNQEARERLSQIADYFLLHNRDIVTRSDDSVMRVVRAQPQLLRRARGLAPHSLRLPMVVNEGKTILAMGAELKNTFCIVRDGEAILSQHIGDLEDATTLQDYRHNLVLWRKLFDVQPDLIVVDQHPNYLSSQLGHDLAAHDNIPICSVQHHHAHIIACMAEHRLDATDRVLGIAMDGLGLGPAGEWWGGEFLRVDYLQCERLAGLAPVAMPGASQAMREPWRNTLAQLLEFADWEKIVAKFGTLDLIRYLQQKPLHNLQRMIDHQINSPHASSAGRLFDAVAAALDICRDNASYEGQAAIELEALATPSFAAQAEHGYPFPLQANQLQTAALWPALLTDLLHGVAPNIIAARFHQGFASAIADTALQLLQVNSLNTVVLTGGVFQNRLLLERVAFLLEQHQVQVLSPVQTPLNDGGLALGQAVYGAMMSCATRCADRNAPSR